MKPLWPLLGRIHQKHQTSAPQEGDSLVTLLLWNIYQGLHAWHDWTNGSIHMHGRPWWVPCAPHCLLVVGNSIALAAGWGMFSGELLSQWMPCYLSTCLLFTNMLFPLSEQKERMVRVGPQWKFAQTEIARKISMTLGQFGLAHRGEILCGLCVTKEKKNSASYLLETERAGWQYWSVKGIFCVHLWCALVPWCFAYALVRMINVWFCA